MPSSRTNSARKSYRRRGKTSQCKGVHRAICSTIAGCRMTKGARRSFCRKNKNTRRLRR